MIEGGDDERLCGGDGQTQETRGSAVESKPKLRFQQGQLSKSAVITLDDQ